MLNYITDLGRLRVRFKLKYIILWCLWSVSTAQNYILVDSIPVLQRGTLLKHPFTGGFNNVQYNNADLNDDGIQDLIIYDRGNKKILPFLVFTSPNLRYEYRPDYEPIFPRIENFLLMRDYNGDGREDLFVGSEVGIEVYKCVNAAYGFQYELVTASLYTTDQGLSSVIMVNPDDYPLVQDMDKDGDLDLVCFDYYTGARLVYHQNLSVESFGHRDALLFQQTDNCYANFQEIACDTFAFGLSCKPLRQSNRLDRVQHVGSGAILSWDMDHDGLEDLLISKIDCFWINYLKNIGSSSQAVFEPKLRRFGAAADTFLLRGFPVPYAVDIDADGQREILISPRATGSNYRIDFEVSSYLLNADLTLNSPSFLQDQTIDLGENSTPVKYDYDQDGDRDLMVGYHSYYKEGAYRGGIALYENIGSESLPSFSLKTTDYMGLMQRQWVNIQPQFFDINSDGNMDLLVTASLPLDILTTQTFAFLGNEKAYFRFDEKVDTLTLPLNIMDVPVFTRDANGQVQVLVGKSNGTLLRYVFQQGIWDLEGELWTPDPDREIRYTCAREANIDGDAEVDLLMSNSERYLLYVKNYRTQALGHWSVDTLRLFHQSSGRYQAIHTVARPMLSCEFSPLLSEIWIGAASGGIIGLVPDPDASHRLSQQPEVYPNPFSDKLFVKSSNPDIYRLYDSQGKFLKEGKVNEGYNLAPFEHLHTGLYVLRFSQSSVKVVKE